MHDPSVVAHEIAVVPCRVRWRDAKPGQPRWTLGRVRRTNQANLGEPCYPWWRPKGYQPRIAGRAFGLRMAFTIWHVEPHGHDAFEVCKHASRWKWHVHHWRIQWHYEQRLRRFLLERCERCGHRFPWGYAPVSHQWNAPRSRWRDGVVKRAYHRECSSLGQRERTARYDEETIRALVAYLWAVKDCSEEEIVQELTGSHATWAEFHVTHRLERLLGYERDNDYRLVKSGGRDR